MQVTIAGDPPMRWICASGNSSRQQLEFGSARIRFSCSERLERMPFSCSALSLPLRLSRSLTVTGRGDSGVIAVAAQAAFLRTVDLYHDTVLHDDVHRAEA